MGGLVGLWRCGLGFFVPNGQLRPGEARHHGVTLPQFSWVEKRGGRWYLVGLFFYLCMRKLWCDGYFI